MLERQETLGQAALAVKAAQVEQVGHLEQEGLVAMVVEAVEQDLLETAVRRYQKIAALEEAVEVEREQQMMEQQLVKIILFMQIIHRLSIDLFFIGVVTHLITAPQFL
jgi:hypothetical protein